MSEPITTAGRLATEIRRIKAKFKLNAPVYQYIPELFGSDQIHWSRGLAAFHRLVGNVEMDLGVLTEGRQATYRDTLKGISTALGAETFGANSEGVSKGLLGELPMERLDALHDHLLTAGRSLSLEKEHAKLVSDELNTLLAEIGSGEASEVDAFLRDRLIELKFVLDRYYLYGPQGVEDAVAGLVGGITIRAAAMGKLAEPTKNHVKAAFKIAKGAMDVLVYAKAGVEALEWSHPVLALIGAS